MVRVRRLRHSDYMYINPDLIERVEGQHQTVLHLVNGVEYVVTETPEEIIDQIIASRVDVIVAAGERLARTAPSASTTSVAAALVAHVVAGDTIVGNTIAGDALGGVANADAAPSGVAPCVVCGGDLELHGARYDDGFVCADCEHELGSEAAERSDDLPGAARDEASGDDGPTLAPFGVDRTTGHGPSSRPDEAAD